MDLEQDGNKVPYAIWDSEKSAYVEKESSWVKEKSFLAVIQINKNLIQTTSN